MLEERIRIYNRFMGAPVRVKGRSRDDEFHLNNGDVSRADFPIPQCLERALIRQIQGRGYTYSHHRGNGGVLINLNKYETALFGKKRFYFENFCLTAGAFHALNAVFYALNGGNVVMPVPSYPLFEPIIRRFNGSISKVQTSFENGFLPTVDRLEEAITEDTTAVLLVSPHNPTGAEYAEEEMQGIVDLCKREDVYLIIDEVFSGLMLDGNVHPTPKYDVNEDKVIRIKGWSKDRGVPGFRVGYVIAPKDIVALVSDYVCLDVGNAPTVANAFISMDAMMRLYMMGAKDVPSNLTTDFAEYESVVRTNLAQYETNDRMIHEMLGDASRIEHLTQTQGGYCKFVKVDGVRDEVGFATELYRDTGVILVPGSLFDISETGWFRLTFSVNPNKLQRGLEVTRDYLQR